MFVPNGPNAIEHEDAGCHCACCEQMRKPDKIVTLPSLMIQENANFGHETINVKISGIGITQFPRNVISISAAIKSAEQVRLERLRQAKFNYPMLECN